MGLISMFQPGTLNGFRKDLFDKAIHKLKGRGGVINRDDFFAMLKQFYKDFALQLDGSSIFTTPCVGLCLRVDQGGQKAGRKFKVHSWVDAIYNQPANQLPLPSEITQVKVWIPEAWFGPVPDNMGDIKLGKHQRQIDKQPTFYCLKKVEVPRPGQLVKVQFREPKDLEQGGEYLELLGNHPGIPSIETLPSPEEALRRKCAGLGPGMPPGAPLLKSNLPVSTIGHDLPKNIASFCENSKGAGFGNKAACRGTHRRWISALEKEGLAGDDIPSYIHYEKFYGNGIQEGDHREAAGRETIIYFPSICRDYISVPPEIIFYFHDRGGFADEDFKRLASSIKILDKDKRNYILVITELPWSKGLNATQRNKNADNLKSVFYAGEDLESIDTGRLDPGNWQDYYTQVSQVIKAFVTSWSSTGKDTFTPRITFVAVGAGGLAARNAIAQLGGGEGTPKKVVMAHADNLEFNSVSTIGDTYMNSAVGGSDKTFLIITKGISASPLSLKSSKYYKSIGGSAPDSISTLSVLGKSNATYALVAFSGYEKIVKSALTYMNPKLPTYPGDYLLDDAPDSENTNTAPARTAMPDAPAQPAGMAHNSPSLLEPAASAHRTAPLPEKERQKLQDLQGQLSTTEAQFKQTQAQLEQAMNEDDPAKIAALAGDLGTIKTSLEDIYSQSDDLLKTWDPTSSGELADPNQASDFAPGSNAGANDIQIKSEIAQLEGMVNTMATTLGTTDDPKILELMTEIDKLKQELKETGLSASKPIPGCLDARTISVIGDLDKIGKTLGDMYRKAWVPQGYKATDFVEEG